MDSNFQALFTHLTHDQVKAVLQDLWRKNDEKQKEISKIREENFAKSMEIIEMNRKVEALTEENELLKMIKTCNDISCSVCLQNFDEEDHQPYVLSCPHIICSDCLDNVNVVSERQNDDRNHDQNLSSKICPECNGPVTTTLKKGCLRA